MSQCEKFEVSYVDANTDLIVAADTLLRSKAAQYDQQHQDLLKPLGGATLVAKATGYGWFTITRVIPESI